MELPRTNFVICPNCKYRYQIGQRLITEMQKPQAICPKCRTEFDPRDPLVPRPKVFN